MNVKFLSQFSLVHICLKNKSKTLKSVRYASCDFMQILFFHILFEIYSMISPCKMFGVIKVENLKSSCMCLNIGHALMFTKGLFEVVKYIIPHATCCRMYNVYDLSVCLSVHHSCFYTATFYGRYMYIMIWTHPSVSLSVFQSCVFVNSTTPLNETAAQIFSKLCRE